MRKRKRSGRERTVAQALRSETFQEELVAAFPELAPALAALRDSWGDDEPGLHIVVGDVLRQHVEAAVDAGAWSHIHSASLFMERMATSPDDDLRNALTVSLLENLGDDRVRLEKARSAMGPETLALSRRIERLWGREP